MRLATRAHATMPPPGVAMPDAIDHEPHALRAGGAWHRTLAVVGYPREVAAGWLDPLLAYPGTATVALFIEPVPAVVAADRLRRQLARLESARRMDADRGRLVDAHVEVAAEDAQDLAARLARGEGRLFRVGLYVTVRGGDLDELDHATQQMRGLLASLLLDCHPTTYRHLQGWISTLPLACDQLGLRRVFDTDALAAAYPFPPSDADRGILYGIDTRARALVRWDRFAADNHNAVVLARSGAGKSYHAKLEALRSLYTGVEVLVIDPEDEYRRLAEAVGGVVLRIGADGVRLNPFDVPAAGTDGDGKDVLVRRQMFIGTFLAVLLCRPLTADERAAVDIAAQAAYEHAGITLDARTQSRPAPLLADLASHLEEGDEHGKTLARQLAPYTTGSHRRLFDGPTTVQPRGHLVVYSLRELPDELKAAGTLLALDAIQRAVTTGPRRRRLIVVDEAWLLMREQAGAEFLSRMAKSARKHWAGLTVVTQDAGDLLSSDLGRVVVANAATQVLLRQAPQTIDAIAEAFDLSDGERAWLLSADRGEGILAAGRRRVAFRSVASPAEHPLVTTDPAEHTGEDS